MVEVEVDFRKTVQDNMKNYFERAKKAKRKREATLKAIKRIEKNVEKSVEKKKKKEVMKKKIKKEWYEKFKWFFTSNGLLVVAGRDATTNEIVIKKHTDKNDLVFHTEAPGSPFCILKDGGNEADNLDILKEVAQFCASHSAAWKRGLGTVEVFWIKPDQVSKEAPSGEYLVKGSFMIRGQKNYLRPELKLAIGVYNDKIMCASLESIKKYTKKYLIIKPGDKKKGEVAKSIKKFFKEFELDDIMRILPTGNSRISK